MSLKMKLTSTICAFLLILGLVITGVFAVPQATVNLGGTLTFKASDVYARVTGTITGSKEDPTLTPIEFNAGSASDTSTWTNNLAFKDDGSTITITINVENLATDRPLYVSITDTLGYVANINKSLTNGAFELAAGEDATATITLDIADKNASLSGANYGYSVELLDESAIQSYDSFENMSFYCHTSANTANVNKASKQDLTVTNIVIPAYVKSGDIVCAVTNVTGNAFAGYTNLAEISIPNTIQSIGAGAFMNCKSLENVIIPSSVKNIDAAAFSGCDSLVSLFIPKGVTSIGGTISEYCSSLKKIVVEDGNAVYDSREDCNALIETNSNKLIQGCNTTVIPDSVTSIVESAFAGCSGLTGIKIPNGVTSIGISDFSGCSSLKNIIIPASVTSISYGAFSDCTALMTINFKGTQEQWNAISGIAEAGFPSTATINYNYTGE